MTIKDSRSKAVAVSAAGQVSDLGALLDGHVAREFADLDVDATMKTMVPEKVELPHVLVMSFENGKVEHEHLWWDQASLLVQVGLLDPAKLPVAGVEQARTLLRVAQGESLTTQVPTAAGNTVTVGHGRFRSTTYFDPLSAATGLRQMRLAPPDALQSCPSAFLL